MQDIELLQFVHESAVMGVKSLEDVRDHIHDSGLNKAVSQQVREYNKLAASSSSLLKAKGKVPKDPGPIAQISSGAITTAKTLVDSSASKIAELVIQGNTMGITKGTQHLNDYAGDDPQVRKLAQKLIKTEEANVEQMKKYL